MDNYVTELIEKTNLSNHIHVLLNKVHSFIQVMNHIVVSYFVSFVSNGDVRHHLLQIILQGEKAYLVCNVPLMVQNSGTFSHNLYH